MLGRERQIVFITTKSQSICFLANEELGKQTVGNSFGLVQVGNFCVGLVVVLSYNVLLGFTQIPRVKGFFCNRIKYLMTLVVLGCFSLALFTTHGCILIPPHCK